MAVAAYQRQGSGEGARDKAAVATEAARARAVASKPGRVEIVEVVGAVAAGVDLASQGLVAVRAAP
ncbi:protein of unknown function [Candidatus Filomicrobium marinum]|uniref:Uncharacterized protein n=1 Tax=Candidatus Filomicrobium marinum TaxID=1608628 RepID=A0A0D6JC19_9HYPH|nr:protein of unknown function [Candidatus Filomicrobium marinum]CPR16773.1 protein of unknown function [Candidatus Filomicrobium marinum]